MNENEIEKRIQTIEYQLHSFLMWMEVLGGSVAPFLTTEDLFDDALGKEFSHDIDLIPVQPPLQCKITLRLMAGKEYRQDPILKSVGPAPWFSLLEYRQVEDEVVTCLTFRKQSFTTDCHHVGLRQCLIRLNSVALLDQIIVIIPELMNAVETFFTTRIQEVFKGRIGTTFFLQNMNDIYNLARKLKIWQTMALKNIEGVQEFQCLVFEATQALLSTKGFVKSKSLKNIREILEKRSKEITAKVNS